MGSSSDSRFKVTDGDAGYVLEDVPHLSDYIAGVSVRLSLSSLPVLDSVKEYAYFQLSANGI